MPLTLHEAFVPSAKQVLVAMRGLIDKAESHCAETGCDAAELIEAKLADTMWSLPWHVRACWMHSGYAINSYKTGEFSPDFTDIPAAWDAMRAQVDDALAQLDATTPETLEAVAGETVGFVIGGTRRFEMTGQNFLLSFNQPNFYFHAATFYDILRMKGLALVKRDFLGAPRVIAG